jgi:charged multivesicular body protein 4
LPNQLCISKIAALFALKKKKVYEAQAEKLSGAKMTIETQILHLEQTSITAEAFSAMSAGATVMKELHGHMYAVLIGWGGRFD